MTAQSLLGVEVELGAEPAADFGCHDADFVFRHADHAGEQGAHEVRHLGRGPEGERFLAGVKGGDATARFDGHRGEALMDHALFDDAVGPGELGLDVAPA